MPKPNIIIHIGYPKTGTTTLQNHLFSKHSGINYIQNKKHPFAELIHSLYFDRENSVKRNLPYFRDILQNEVEKHDKQNVYVFSSESLTSFSMFFRFSPSPYVWTLEPNSVARKLFTVFCETGIFSNVKIIMSIRLQSELLKSMYAQVYNLVFKRFNATKDFQRFLQYALIENPNQFISDVLQYDGIVENYEDLFGIGNVDVQVFENLKHRPEEYVRKLCDFMQIDAVEANQIIHNKVENNRSGQGEWYPSDSRNVVEVLSFYKNRYFAGTSFGLANSTYASKLKGIRIPAKTLKNVNISEYYQDKLTELFASSNQNLSERRNLNLGEYGYFGNIVNADAYE